MEIMPLLMSISLCVCVCVFFLQILVFVKTLIHTQYIYISVCEKQINLGSVKHYDDAGDIF